MGYGLDWSLGTYTDVNSVTPSRIAMRISRFSYLALTASTAA